ncbi:DNA-formamidopyrimidine glycosylase family protein [Microbispora sp. ATCC PTA-5024]|uniref:DNA-formamidopyrimidine glycosylase family protein n=1 Tax=Microbispora sp. ATCC PTA-5024 TaxID=316330 RepID=UPI0003DB9FD8|nr:DNA-formamidopyrimidine glycosylase family protein [Microbispora sp. ATCC PTA-5024]ETK35838.1 DNA glycosylase [Microbispora sp. ATCC PTA-5024]
MPEGDAVYRTAKRLREALDGRMLTRSDFRVPRYATADLRGRTVLTTISRGKHLLTRVEGGLTVHTHLRMDGTWRVSPAGQAGQAGQAYGRAGGRGRSGVPGGDVVRLILANARWQAVGIKLGMVDLVPTDREDRVVGHLGPDLLGPDWDAALAARNLARDPGRTIGEALLDQRDLAGIGTIWRAETLWAARLSPWRTVGTITPDELEALAGLAHDLMEASKDAPLPVTTGDARPGRSLLVYGRAHRPCRRCGAEISSGDIGAQPYERLIYWCRACQAD